MKNNRYVKMNEFLKNIVNVMKRNPELEITTNFIYGQLMEYGQYKTPAEKCNKYDIDVSEKKRRTLLFYNWDLLAKRLPHLTSFITKNDPNNYDLPHFFAFNNGEIDAAKEIKLYFNFDDEHLDTNFKYILNYLSQNNIPHQSKIGSTKRADSIVIRVDNIRNAIAIINFIDANPALSNYMGEVNPFTPTVLKVGVATDRYSSYNLELSNLIHNYLLEKKYQGDLDNVSIQGFKKHIGYLRNRRLPFMKEDDKFYEFMSHTMEEDFTDTEVFSLISRKNQNIIISKHSDEEIGNLVNKALMTHYDKYDLSWTINALKRYLETGDVSSITKDNDARNIFGLILTKEEVQDYINRHVETCGRDYLTIFVSHLVELHDKKKIVPKNKFDNELMKKIGILQNASIETILKYNNPVQLALGIQKYACGDPSLFTNRNQAREYLMNAVRPEEILNITKSALLYYYNIDVMDSEEWKLIAEVYSSQIYMGFSSNKKIANQM